MLSRDALKEMPDDQLIASLKRLVAKHFQLTAALLAYIAEVEERKLHLGQAYGSMFKFCTKALGLPEPMAYKYIGVARAIRKHEAILPMVRAGRLHLSAALILIPHLTEDNSAELLDAAAGRSKRWVEKLIAERYPKADVPSQVRKLPIRPSPPQTSSQAGSTQVEIPTGQEPVVDSPVVARAVKAGCDRREAATSGVATAPDHGQPAAQLSGRGGSAGTGSSYIGSSRQEPKLSSGEDIGREAAGAAAPGSGQGSAGTGSSCDEGTRQAPQPSAAAATSGAASSPGHGRPAAQISGVTGTGSSCDDCARQASQPTSHATAAPARQQRPRIEPLAPARYKVQFTAGAELVSKLRQAQELLRHQVPDGDPAAICELGLDLLIESLLKKRFAMGTQKPAAKRRGATSHKPGRAAADGGSPASKEKGASSEPDSVPSQSAAGSEQEATGRREGATPCRASGGDEKTPPASAATDKPSRYIPAAVRRLVAERDGLQCTFIGPDGRRCESRDVEFHHLKPFARGGEHSAEQLTLRCRAHNAFQAELDYGTEHIKRRVRQRRARSAQRRTVSERPARPSADAAW